ncbi:retinol dehydrogenase 11-like isoform X2 [Palaemon carinicauda]|uniref:retinol dehydrogenase 11-like isoform X2 n=1 Tax=Palaemon carinicauda TaxID=392227 RepID=UPI0035B62DFA
MSQSEREEGRCQFCPSHLFVLALHTIYINVIFLIISYRTIVLPLSFAVLRSLFEQVHHRGQLHKTFLPWPTSLRSLCYDRRNYLTMWLWITGIICFIVAVRVIYRRQSGVCTSKKSLDGKTAIVTGSSAGIGKETARDLARRGARVIVACRNVQRAQKVADDIFGTTGNGQVFVKQLDTSDLTSVRTFAKQIIDTEKELHILVNNAGIAAPSVKTLTSDGLEMTMATNHFGHFLLTNMLLDLLRKSAPSRVINVSSQGHKCCKNLVVDDLNYEKRPYPNILASYGQTKLANILFTVELAERMKGTGRGAWCSNYHPLGGVRRCGKYLWRILC